MVPQQVAGDWQRLQDVCVHSHRHSAQSIANPKQRPDCPNSNSACHYLFQKHFILQRTCIPLAVFPDAVPDMEYSLQHHTPSKDMVAHNEGGFN